MQEQPKGNSNILIIIGIFIALGVAGYFYITRDQSPDALLTSTGMTGQVTPVDGNFLSVLNELKKLKLNDDLFKTAVWDSLIDYGKDLTPEEKFRPNPFAPLPPANGTTTTPR